MKKIIRLSVIFMIVLRNFVFSQSKPSNANYTELSFDVGTPKVFGNTTDIRGNVMSAKAFKEGYYIIMTRKNFTYRVWVKKDVWMLVRNKEDLLLRNCRFL